MSTTVQLVPLPEDSQGRIRGAGFYIDHLRRHLKNHDQITVVSHPSAESDLIHYPFYDFFFRSLPLFPDKPTVVTIHDVIPLMFPQHFPPGIKGRLRFLWQREALKRATLVITDSQASKRDICATLPVSKHRVEVVPLAADPELTEVTETKQLHDVANRYQLPDEFLLYVGDLNWNKNPQGLISVAGQADLPLVVVGGSAAEPPADPTNAWNKEWVQFLKEARKNDRIITPGFVPTEDLAAIYSLATVYLQLSFYEGFGLPVLEAMACGCPVVASSTGSLPEVGGDAAILVDPTTIGDAVEVINRIRSDKKIAASLKKRGLKHARSYSWDRTAEQTVQAYEKALQKS